MSLGSIIGAAIGGGIGFVIGGWPGAAYEAGIGFGIGVALDAPDIPMPGTPRQDFQVTGNVVGSPIFDCLGTVKIVGGTFLAYGKERAEAIYQETPSGKGGGGSTQQQTGNNYYMSWVQGLCLGPVDVLYAIYKDNDELVYEGPLYKPATGGKETITLSGIGSADFYFGTTDQALNSSIGQILDDPTLNTPWRGLCYAFFNDCLLGQTNRVPMLSFVVGKFPAVSCTTKTKVLEYDYNPAAAQWYIFAELVKLDATWLHNGDFSAAADTLSDEGRGISMLFDRAADALSYLEPINEHIDGLIRYGSDGKFHPFLYRDDYSIATLPRIRDDNVLEDPTLERKAWNDTLNMVKVQYNEIISDRELIRIRDPFTGQTSTPGIDWVGLQDYTRSENKIQDGLFTIAYVDLDVTAPAKTSAKMEKKQCGDLRFSLVLFYNTATGDGYSLHKEAGSDNLYLQGDSLVNQMLLFETFSTGAMYGIEAVNGDCFATIDGDRISGTINGTPAASVPCENLTSGKAAFRFEDSSVAAGTITATSTIVSTGESVGLTYVGELPDGVSAVSWEIVEGEGSISSTGAKTAIYTAPASNPGCQFNPLIRCTYCPPMLFVDFSGLQVNGHCLNCTVGCIAWWHITAVQCNFSAGVPYCNYAYSAECCNGDYYDGGASFNWNGGAWVICQDGLGNPDVSKCTVYEAGDVIDMRTPEMIAQGCCGGGV